MQRKNKDFFDVTKLLTYLPYNLVESVWLNQPKSTQFPLFTVVVDPSNLLKILNFFKLSIFFRANCLVDITCTDYLSAEKRFELGYYLLSTHYNFRICVKVFLDLDEPVESATTLFGGANWLEREIWDMFGVFFTDHPDLRRILTDYGFDGHPLRKDFPLSGYVEVRYDDESRRVLLEPVSLTQEYRYFDFISPWEREK
jgi:NADH/F420H2 dehydrogenase subunit C